MCVGPCVCVFKFNIKLKVRKNKNFKVGDCLSTVPRVPISPINATLFQNSTYADLHVLRATHTPVHSYLTTILGAKYMHYIIISEAGHQGSSQPFITTDRFRPL